VLVNKIETAKVVVGGFVVPPVGYRLLKLHEQIEAGDYMAWLGDVSTISWSEVTAAQLVTFDDCWASRWETGQPAIGNIAFARKTSLEERIEALAKTNNYDVILRCGDGRETRYSDPVHSWTLSFKLRDGNSEYRQGFTAPTISECVTAAEEFYKVVNQGGRDG
jgi:hypothetical protein